MSNCSVEDHSLDIQFGFFLLNFQRESAWVATPRYHKIVGGFQLYVHKKRHVSIGNGENTLVDVSSGNGECTLVASLQLQDRNKD